MFVTRRDIDSWYSLAKRAQRDPQRPTRGQVLAQTAEVGAGALLSGFLGGRFGRTTLFGVDYDLIAGLALTGAGAMGVGGEWSRHLVNFGNGLFAGYLAKVGAGLGTQMRAATPGLQPLTVDTTNPFLFGTEGSARGLVGGYGNAVGAVGGAVTEAEMAQMAQSLRPFARAA